MVDPNARAAGSRVLSQADQGSDERAGPAGQLPTISLPRGGGAIRGMGEKFAANPVKGTGSMSVPILTSPGRSGFGPQLSLSYDSGAGNGPFGFGWSVSLPSITRKTDQGLPRYFDGEESDVFTLSGAEDLVPTLVQSAQGEWVREELPRRTVDGLEYDVRRYRPRVEGLFALIERWTNATDAADVFWRSISKDNLTTWYGKTAESRIADPADARRIFSWLICQSHDDKGNVVVYGYRSEDSALVLEDASGNSTAKASERNRTPRSRSAQRYLKRVRYGNRDPYFPTLSDNAPWPVPEDAQAVDGSNAWHFEVVVDYGEHARDAPTPNDTGVWPVRPDTFSSYRAGFEVRSYRICQRVLMFHHFPGEAGVERNCLVRSTDFTYSDEVDPGDARNPVYTFLRSVNVNGYRRNDGGYDRRAMPPVEFGYSEPVVQDQVEEVDPRYLANLPVGLDGRAYRWTDLHGVGVPGILSEQADAWFYADNTSPLPERMPDGSEVVRARFGELSAVALKPNVSLRGGAEIMDLAGDGRPDVVVLRGSVPGLYEHDEAEGWEPFRPFTSRLNRDLQDPNVKFVDLDGDGHTDVLITEDDAFVWHQSLAEAGFGPSRRVAQALDEEEGPRLVLADRTQSIYLADLSGDGLTDLVRIRNGEVCYWPNLGHGRFGAKVTMDRAPWFDQPDQFDHKRIRLADIDGSGTTDIIYLHRGGVRLYFNQSGNGWSEPHLLNVFPRVDDLVSIVPTDLLGNGTACLVWSSPLPGDTRRPMRYVALMGDRKPHLLVHTTNSLGAETRIEYAPSTRFYVQDKLAGRPWITRLPYPVHVVERVVTYDHVSRSRFVTRNAYHHGYFDADEREFRGFGMVEQWDSEEFAALAGGDLPAENIAAASQVPPVHTKTWFHTGAPSDRVRTSREFEQEYFREPGLSDDEARALLLPDTVLPAGLSAQERREASRALKGSTLRQEVYADDAGPDAGAESLRRAQTPYTVTEQNLSVRTLQSRGPNQHAVLFTHPRETISYHYERSPADPRIQHVLTLEVDAFGNVLKQAVIGYGRRTQIRVADGQGNLQLVPNPALADLQAADQAKQVTSLLTYTENRVTNPIETPDAHRNPLPCEAITFELTGYPATGLAGRHDPSDLVEPDPAMSGRVRHKFNAPEVDYEAAASGAQRRRPIECLRTLYRRDDLSALLPLGQLQPLALPGETYKLALTPGLIAQAFRRQRQGQAPESLLPDPAAVLGAQDGNGGGYLQSQVAKGDGRFPASDPDDHWWVGSGQSFHSTNPADDAGTELAEALKGFFVPRRFRNAFGHDAFAALDDYSLLLVETRDALGNRTTADANDYRVLQPRLVSDPNHNQTEVAYDTLGMVVAAATMGKPLPADVEGDTLTEFVSDLTQAQLDGFLDAVGPQAVAATLLKDASTRTVYDYDRFRRTREANPNDPTRWQPVCSVALARETHVSSPVAPQGVRIQLSFSYSDGFGREVQKKVQAEPGPLDLSDPGSPRADPRWVGSGWTIFNSKGKPVRQYEPFFSATHQFEFGVEVGVSPVQFYDPAERSIAVLHPNHTYEKVVFDPWHQTTYDVNDTCAPRNAQTGDPRTDPDIAGYVEEYFKTQPATWQTWHSERVDGALGLAERDAAERAESHADTPTTEHSDTLGRPFLTLARNRVVAVDHDLDGVEEDVATRVEIDIEGNHREVRDAIVQSGDPLGRVVMRYAFDMLGSGIHQVSMEAGARWTLKNVAGKPIRTWDSRGHNFTITYDALGRPLEQTVGGTTADSDPRTLNREILVERIEYGEPAANATAAEEAEATRLNLRTRVLRHFDSAGLVTMSRLDDNGQAAAAYDFKGNLLTSTRRLVSDYTSIPDWRLNPQLSAESFESRTSYDAFNRPIQSIAPRSSLAHAKRNVIQPVFNEANLLERVDVWLERATEPATLLDPTTEAPSPVGVAGIDYDAMGQRQRIDYKNGASTLYTYDPLTFRVTQLLTLRDTASHPGDDPQPPIAGWPGKQVQNLRYTYDPAGNITHIQDDAQQAVYFKNKRVEPSNDYIYDALYRLIQATGREHLGQAGAPMAHSHNDAGRVDLLSVDGAGRFAPNDGNAMGTYTERYVYDVVGNFVQMQHRGDDPAQPRWTRAYDYLEPSLVEDGSGGAPSKSSNRLSRTRLDPNGADPTKVEPYEHDVHGNLVRMPHLAGGAAGPNMHWDHNDHLRQADLGGGGASFYVYDASGQRVRMVWEKAPGLIEERIYLGGAEIYRRHNGPIDADSVTLERETFHVMDDEQRIAFVETRTLDVPANDPAPRQQIRYQLGNHLGSSSLELDMEAHVISYEEYAPYGSSTYQAVRSQTETPKRYRYSGKARDEETGLYYHGARYYAPWLGRWTGCDPAGIGAGLDLYSYAMNRPLSMVDPDGQWPEWVDKQVGAAKESLRAAASSAHAVAEGAIWNPTVAGAITRAERLAIDTARGKTIEKFLGNVKGLPGALGATAKDADRALRTTVEQIKTTYARDVGKVVRGATTQAARFIANNAEHAGKEARAVVNMATGTAKSVVTRAENAVAAVPGSVAAPKVSVGLPGPLGTALKVLAPVGAALSAASLPENIEKGDFGAALADAAGFAAGAMETGAIALSYFGGGAGAAGGAATPLIGTGGVAGAGLATGGAVVGAFAAGAAIGVGLEKALDVSEYSSEVGLFAYEKLKEAGLNDTASLVAGGVVTVAATPTALVYATLAKGSEMMDEHMAFIW